MTARGEDGPEPAGEAFRGQVELLERDTELGAIDAIIASPATGGRLLVIEGPPGIGKTSVMAKAKLRALQSQRGVRAHR